MNLTQLESASPSDIWKHLTPAERETFIRATRDPNSMLTMELLRSDALQRTIVYPWWDTPHLVSGETERSPSMTGSTAKYGRRPSMMSIPSTLLERPPGPDTGPPLLYNICIILCVFHCIESITDTNNSHSIAYAFVTRHFGVSPLSSLSELSLRDEYSAAVHLLRTLVPFMFDNKSRTIYTSTDDITTEIWAKLVDSGQVIIIFPDSHMFVFPDLSIRRRVEHCHCCFVMHHAC